MQVYMIGITAIVKMYNIFGSFYILKQKVLILSYQFILSYQSLYLAHYSQTNHKC